MHPIIVGRILIFFIFFGFVYIIKGEGKDNHGARKTMNPNQRKSLSIIFHILHVRCSLGLRYESYDDMKVFMTIVVETNIMVILWS